MFVACTTYSSVAPASAGPPPTTATLFVIRSCCTSPTTTTVGSGPVAGLPSPSVKQVRQLDRVDDGLVRDQRARRHTVVDEQIERHDGRLPVGVSVPCPAPGSGGVRSVELT